MPEVSTDQIGSATVWFASNAGIAATILAFVCIALAIDRVWTQRRHEKALKDANDSWVKALTELAENWGKRIDQIRGDTKDAFGQNAALADKMVEAMHSLKIEIARMSARRDV